MKHWHKCRRWKEKQLSCPFGGKGHEEREDQSDEIKFKKTSGARVPAVVAGTGGRPTVGVREPRRGVPDPLAAAIEKPPPSVPEKVEDIIGKPFPGVPDPAPAMVAPVMEQLQAAVAEVPEKWRPSEEQVRDLLAKLGAKNEGRGNTVRAMAEEAVTGAFEESAGFPGELLPVAVIPLIKHIFQKVFAARPGVIGKAGPADPARAGSTFRTESGRTGGEKAVRGPGAAMRAVRTKGGFGGMSINAAARMRELMAIPARRRQNISGRQHRGGL